MVILVVLGLISYCTILMLLCMSVGLALAGETGAMLGYFVALAVCGASGYFFAEIDLDDSTRRLPQRRMQHRPSKPERDEGMQNLAELCGRYEIETRRALTDEQTLKQEG
jgi:hypothetical protein